MSSAGSTPAQLSWPNPAAPVTYSLTLTAVAQDEEFALSIAPPHFGGDGPATAPAGTSLEFTGQRPRIDGPATLPGPASMAIGTFAACAAKLPNHGLGPYRASWDVH